MKLLFGYGTLRSDLGSYSYPPRKGGGRHTGEACTSLGLGRTTGELWRIQNDYGIWAGVKEVEGSTVLGEVFEIPDKNWDGIDRSECTSGGYYYRKEVPVKLASGETVQAFIYFAGPTKTEWLQKIDSGDWRDYLDTKNKAPIHE